jgi:integral membrane protein (TIGR01906 family)
VLVFAVKWLFVICLPILLLTASICWAINSHWLYQYGFDKYDVGQTTGLADVELEKAANGLIDYFNSREEYISLSVTKNGETFELFNQHEVIHLMDVKGLFWLDYWILFETLTFILVYSGISIFWQRGKHWRQLARRTVIGSGITLALGLVLGLGILLNFDQLFLQFHLLSFSNDFWQLDPSRDYLIMLFPGGFWYDTATFCAGITAGLAVILGGVAGGYLWFSKKQL